MWGKTMSFRSTRFDYVKYDSISMEKQGLAKEICLDLEEFIQKGITSSRPTSLALTALEEVYMWIGKAIRDEQTLTRKSELQEGRGNE